MLANSDNTALSVQNLTKAFMTGSALPKRLSFSRADTHGEVRFANASGNGKDKANGHTSSSSGRLFGLVPRSILTGQGKRKVMAVDHINFAVQRGEIYGILGPNGSGKSTLIRCISTLLVPDEGQITVFGLDVQAEEMAVKRLINRVSAEASFFKKLSPMENLLYAARLYDIPAAQAKKEVVRILTRLGLKPDVLGQPLEEMSRGMQQKVAIARALLTAPILLLLDEPTTGLDPRSKREVQSFIQELRAAHDATILLTTHDMHEAEALCNRIAILDEGKFVAEGTSAELKALVSGVDGQPPTLEDVFMALTGKALRREEEEEEPEAA